MLRNTNNYESFDTVGKIGMNIHASLTPLTTLHLLTKANISKICQQPLRPRGVAPYSTPIAMPLAEKEDPTNMNGSSEDTPQTIIQHFRCHSSTAKIRPTVCSLKRFSFQQISIQEMFDQLIKPDQKKNETSRRFSPKIPIYFPHH